MQRNHEKCIGCGECVIQCPTRAWVRSGKKYYRLTLLGRTGKKNPRMGEDFIKWADEESIIKIITNTYEYVKEYIDPRRPGARSISDISWTGPGLRSLRNGPLRM